MRKAWQGGPALPRDPPGPQSLTRLRLLPRPPRGLVFKLRLGN